ncbi:MAG: COG2426 family protein [Candidatus Fimenecus sp.]
MAETLAQWLVQTFGEKIPSWLTVFIISMFPILENRGGMIAARLLGMNMGKAFLISYIGNVIPIPFIMMFITKIFKFLRRSKGFDRFIVKMEQKAEKNKEKILNYKMWGLLLFVAIPIPGTGGWTGALMAALLELPKKKSIPITFLGVLIAGLIMTTITYGIGWIITGH